MANMLTQHEKESIVDYCCKDGLCSVDNDSDLFQLAYNIIDETIKRIMDKGYCIRKQTTYEKPPKDTPPAKLRMVKDCYDPSLGKRN